MSTEIIFILIAGIAILTVLAIVGRMSGSSNSDTAQKIKKNIAKLDNKIHSDEYDIRVAALIEADKLLDQALKSRKVRGNTLGERLKHAKKLFEKKQYNAIWQAHKLRNKLVHEMDYRTTKEVLLSEYRVLKKGIQTLIK